jgi:dienelactone hydrolase
MPIARMFAFLILLVFFGSSLSAQETDAEKRLLGWMDRIAQRQLDARAKRLSDVRTVEDAERRKTEVRKKILELIGGLSDYNGPLNARVTGRIERPRYVVEKVLFESLPGLLVTANLYRPNQPGKYPGVLIPLGHWEEGKAAVQRIAINLALKGFVVLAYDPLGQGERLQAYDRRLGGSLGAWATEQHMLAGAQCLLAGESLARYFIWDGKRSLDYLLSRAEVETEKIGCNGCSGGGTVTTYLSALDPRVMVAAPSCYMNSFRVLFSGPVGDSEQSLPGFLAAGLDQTDFVELFAPKPWLITSTLGDFFTPEGARQVFEEARGWYRLYGAEDKAQWFVGSGPHGTPREVREAIYAWMIRWLKDGKGDSREEDVEILPAHALLVTQSGQVSEEGSRDIGQVIFERLQTRKRQGTLEELRDELRHLVRTGSGVPRVRVVAESLDQDRETQTVSLETEPGIEIPGTLLIPRSPGRKPGVIVVETEASPSKQALQLAAAGSVVLALAPRGLPRNADHRPFTGDWLANTRAWLIGRNLPGMRAFDILRGVDVLAARPDVDAATIRAVARDVAGVWLLMAAALDSRLSRVWIDRTPHSLLAALERPLHKNLHAAVIPGFCLKWDLGDLRKAIAPRSVLWTDPTDWLGNVVPLAGDYRYRGFEEGDGRIMDDWMR